MKKALFIVAVLAIGGAAFAQNKTIGLDFHFGVPVSTADWNGTTKFQGKDAVANFLDIGFQFKMATYDGFLLNGIIGVYASVGVNIGSGFTPTMKIDGNEDSALNLLMGKDYGNLNLKSGEFMIGPSFGADIGSARFQTGVAFHFLFADATGGGNSDSELVSETTSGGTRTRKTKAYHYKKDFRSVSVGFALTPQFRFMASKPLSVIVGADFVFDFPVSGSYTVEMTERQTTRTYNAKGELTGENAVDEKPVTTQFGFEKAFRFGCTPYIGVGINF